MKFAKIILAMASLLVLAGCTTHKPAEANVENVPFQVELHSDFMTDISGNWQVRAFDDTMLTEDSASFPTISFLENGMITATAGCNRMGGDYQYSNGQLIIKDGMYQTKMLCDNEQMMRNEQLLAQTLHDTLAVTALSADSVLVQGTHTMIIVR